MGGFTSEEELKRGVGKCPTSKECGQIGGECFPKKCPGGLFVKIGCIGCNASRGCVCCKPVFKCYQDRTCKAKGGRCQFPKCEEGFTEIGRCQPEADFPANAASSQIPNLKYL